jgi:DNA-binding CsgD family transcriptional regulator
LINDPFLQVSPLQFPDFVEAAVRSGHLDEAADLVDRLEVIADANGSSWTRGTAERSRALVTVDDSAERHYAAAITTLASADVAVELARAHLLYGEWLRRLKRRREARDQLRTAQEMFERAGASLFAERARSELEATGAHTSPGGRGQTIDLTPQEAMVARLAASGSTNAEIGATLFISANTVDYHLRKVFQKLGITSRRQLAERLDA